MLKFPTVSALRAALRRKRLALAPVRVPSRKQHLFATEDVANCVIGWGRGDADAAEGPVDESDKEAAM